MPEPIVVVVRRKKVHHGFHFIMTCITWGLWFPIWLIAAVSA